MQIINIPNDPVPNLADYFAACDTATRVVSELQPLYLELETRWAALAQIEGALPGLSVVSQGHAQVRAQAARTEADLLPRRLEDIRQIRNKPPAPPDGVGRPRMPENWFQLRRGDKQAHELLRARTHVWDATRDVVGADMSRLQFGEWQAAADFGGGQSNGVLWVFLDSLNDRIVDVSEFNCTSCSHSADFNCHSARFARTFNSQRDHGYLHGLGTVI